MLGSIEQPQDGTEKTSGQVELGDALDLGAVEDCLVEGGNGTEGVTDAEDAGEASYEINPQKATYHLNSQ